jgi:hypothetical protein
MLPGMNFTFGIVTGGNQEAFVREVIDSIFKYGGPGPDIIVVGGSNLGIDGVRFIPFDESVKPLWITKKKNLITQLAVNQDIVYMHDYVALDPDWYEGWCKFGSDYKACMNRIINLNGERFRDWTIFPFSCNSDMPWKPAMEALLPYDFDISKINKYMYFSGAYWVAKKEVMLEFPLNEELVWAQGEDVLWSTQYRAKYLFSMNPLSTVRLIKPGKDKVFNLCSEETLSQLRK